MRIIAGRFRGRVLSAVGQGDQAAHLRPTTDRVRENLFNMLASGRFGQPFAETAVLDLFAGTGALGLEALSRGAGQVTFVEKGRVAQDLIRKNIALLECGDVARLVGADATRLPALPGPAVDLVFMDPPYEKGLGERALRAAIGGDRIAPGALIVWEESAAIAPPPGVSILDQRRYGRSQISFLRYDADCA